MVELHGFKEKGSAALIARGLESEEQFGRFVSPPFNLAKAFACAVQMSRRYTLAEGHRTYDVILVAAALELKATDFFTFDDRQGRLAEAEGLRVNKN